MSEEAFHPAFDPRWISKELEVALEAFGEYSFDDKGPDEVMDVEDIARRLSLLTREQRAASFESLSREFKERGDRGTHLASALVEYLEDDLGDQLILDAADLDAADLGVDFEEYFDMASLRAEQGKP